eukprot:6564366-Prymnesium_polylepis.2
MVGAGVGVGVPRGRSGSARGVAMRLDERACVMCVGSLARHSLAKRPTKKNAPSSKRVGGGVPPTRSLLRA